MQQQIAEIAGVERFESLLIRRVEFAALAIGEGVRFTRRNRIRSEAAIFPAVDPDRQSARRPALFVDVGGGDRLLHQAHLIVGVENGEVGFQSDELGAPTQNFCGDGMKRAEPWHALGDLADKRGDAMLHLARRLVGERHREDIERTRLSRRDDVGDACGENAGLSRAGACKDKNRAVRRLDRLALLRVQPVEIPEARLRRRERPGRQPATRRLAAGGSRHIVVVKGAQGVGHW